jgi:hypothetical protein
MSRRVCVSVRVSREGGKRRLPGDVAADDAQSADEGDPVRIVALPQGGPVYEVPQGVVDQEKRVDLLLGPGGVLGAQDETGPA